MLCVLKKRCHWTARQVERIHKLELMDEFEEWHLIQGHYFVLCASRPETDLWVHNCIIFNKTPAEENWEGAGKRRCQWASRDWLKTNLNRELEEMGSWAMSWWSAVSRCNIPVYPQRGLLYTYIVTPFYSCCMNLSTDSRGPLLLHLWVHAAVATVPPARIQQEGGDASVVQCAVWKLQV